MTIRLAGDLNTKTATLRCRESPFNRLRGVAQRKAARYRAALRAKPNGSG